MKKVMIGLFAMICFAVNAQEVNFGVKGGVNFASFGGDNDGLEGAVGFYIGGLANIGISEKFSVQPELLYSLEGGNFENSISGVDDPTYSYIRIPVMAKYAVAESFSLVAGPQIGFIVDDKDIENVGSFDFGLGAGAEYFLSNGLGFEARYNFGLTNLIDEGPGDIKQNNFQLGLAYRF